MHPNVLFESYRMICSYLLCISNDIVKISGGIFKLARLSNHLLKAKSFMNYFSMKLKIIFIILDIYFHYLIDINALKT